MLPKSIWRLLTASFIVRFIIASAIWPGIDEAYYYLYSVNLSLSYFDHPPMVALAGRLFPFLTTIINPLTLRLTSIFMFSISTLYVYKLAKLYFDDERAFLIAAVFAWVPMFFISGTLLLPDAPLILFWVLGLYCFKKVLQKSSISNWILLGLSIGLGMISKYTAVFLGLGVFLYLIWDKESRKLLLSPGPYIAVICAVIVFLPVIIWNFQHDFSSFAFHSGRVGGTTIKFRYFYQSLFGQLAYLLPFYFITALYVAVKILLKREKSELDKLSVLFGTIPLFVFIIAALFKKVLPHWPIIAYITLVLPVSDFYYNMKYTAPKKFKRYMYLHFTILTVFMLMIFAQLYLGLFMNKSVPQSGRATRHKVRDITVDIIGWPQLAEYLAENYADDKNIFVFTNRWYLGGEIVFALKNKLPVLCLADKKKSHGFYYFQDQTQHLGQTGLFITTSKFYKDPSEVYKDNFDFIELEKKIEVKRRGKIVKIIYIYRCENFKRLVDLE